jgi:hypothetical protein
LLISFFFSFLNPEKKIISGSVFSVYFVSGKHFRFVFFDVKPCNKMFTSRFLMFENVPYKIVFSRCQIRVQESARMQDFAPFTPELTGALSFPQTPGRTATALCAVGQHVSRVEGPLHVVGGY